MLAAVFPFNTAVTFPGTVGASVSTAVFFTASTLFELPPTLTVICLPVTPPDCTVTVSDVFNRLVNTVPTVKELSVRSGIVCVIELPELLNTEITSSPAFVPASIFRENAYRFVADHISLCFPVRSAG
ncbi:hypothetical protein D3C76_1484150 [compost metagenome]